MARQITHQQDERGIMRQIVSPETLRQILENDGDDYSRPKDFSADDEWRVDSDSPPMRESPCPNVEVDCPTCAETESKYTRVDAGTGRIKPLDDSDWPDNSATPLP